jgi:hypothetical protein
LVILIVAFALARPLSQRLAALALVLLVGRDWWESVVSVACGHVYGIRCVSESVLATKHIPASVNLVLVLAGVALMVAAAIIAAEIPPSRWILASIAASFLIQVYFAVLFLVQHGPQMRLMGLINLLGYGASLAFAVRAGQERTRRATILFAAGLATFALPVIWSSVRDLTMA